MTDVMKQAFQQQTIDKKISRIIQLQRKPKVQNKLNRKMYF
jgi:hypothetical protein